VNPELYEEELAALRAERNELRERLVAMERAFERGRDTSQQEKTLAKVLAEQMSANAMLIQRDEDFRARVEAEFGQLREQLLADARGTFSELAKCAFIQTADKVDAAEKRLMRGEDANPAT